MPTHEVAFCFPIKCLENSRLILEPFVVSTHADLFVQGSSNNPELFTYVTQGPFATRTDFEAFYNSRIGSSATETFFAILTKSNAADGQETFAGVIGFQNAGLANATIEIGFIVILPTFQRTFVTSNAVGLLLLYTFDQPPHGLALRRCQWQALANNEASRRVAARMLFTFKGVQRFQRVVPMDKVGNGFDTSGLPDEMRRKLGQSRVSAFFTHYCDEWQEKRREVVAVMERR